MTSVSTSASTALPISLPFDLESYISRYDTNSETRLQRLLFLAHQLHQIPSHNENDAHQEDSLRAFELAVAQMKATGNHRRYLHEFGAVDSSTPTDSDLSERPPEQTCMGQYLDFEPAFVQASQSSWRSQLEVLEGRLASAQSHIHKESIRMALLALAEFHRGRGDLREAWRRLVRSREYCVNGTQHCAVSLLLIELSVDLRDWSNVRDTVARAELTILGEVDDSLFTHKLRTANALAHLAEKKYAEAAKLFTSISPDLTNQFTSVISAEDLTMYGALLSLATLDRVNMHSLVIEGPFKERLELVPAVRDALHHYSLAEYGQCLLILQHTIQRDILLDIHLHSHVPTLLEMIRDRCIVQYFQPYSSVSLEKMGGVFGYSLNDIQDIVATLIHNGGGHGISFGEEVRINALEKTLSVAVSCSTQKRKQREARVKAAQMGISFVRNVEGLLLRIACLENGIVLQGGSDRKMRSNRARDVAPTTAATMREFSDQTIPGVPDTSESDESHSDDVMDIDRHIVNPNDF